MFAVDHRRQCWSGRIPLANSRGRQVARLALRAGRSEKDAPPFGLALPDADVRKVLQLGFDETVATVKTIVRERADRRPDQTADPALQPASGERSIQLTINSDQ
ncbi:hypothetical protein [Saccharopolyspora hattusasensis]|uniref:hypothetical protein n=1 Tax=Saccharopolyspora hattusasensis TaxID=1128679 RepID=UPI003D98164E